MPSLFYIRLISLTAGTLVYLFLLALILGHRRPRLFERLLFFLNLSLFLIYAGGLLEINASIQYASPPYATRLFYSILHDLGMAFLAALLVHVHFVYVRSIQGRKLPRWCGIFVWLLYAFPFISVLETAFILRHLPVFSFPAVLSWLASGGAEDLPLVVLLCAVVDFLVAKSAKDLVGRKFFVWLGAISGLIFVPLALRTGFATIPPLTGDGTATAITFLCVLPGALLLYYAVRRNFLEYGAQRNLMYALPATFLALLYLALVRRVSGWLEPVLPPEATASVLLFVLIFLFEPLERVIGPVLHRRLSERMDRVQRLTSQLQQEARQGKVAHLVASAEKSIREEFGLAAVRISIPRDAALNDLEAPGGLGHTAQMRLMKDGQEIGVLEAATTGSYLTGETSAALEFLAEQLAGMVDLARLIEDKLRLERELAERERMAVLGQMAASVSHNLRNPLSSMKTVLQVQLENPDLPLDVRRDCTLIVGEIDRMSAKLTQLLHYAKPTVHGERVAAVAVAAQTAWLFGRDAERRNVRLEFEKPTHEILAQASEEALSEVLSNLIVNAMEAQPDGGRVRISVGCYDGRLDIVVDDDGPGITQELRAKIFQPYFTTKATGTGLGLAIVARRIEELGGTLAIESPLHRGKGARFHVTLPLAEEEDGTSDRVGSG
ncbi:MAG TPA: ATP-binding protein [Verrucomicrobiae bacterium]|nr:ATP-binding protein [Verrucomicrobiae bacterium]